MSKRKSRPPLRVIMGGVSSDVAPSERPIKHGTALRAPRPLTDGPPSSLLLPDVDLPLRPQSSAAEEEFCPRYYEGQHERRQVAADVDRLRYAIVDLASIELPASRLLKEINPTFDRPIIRDRLIRAIDCLSHFAEEWRLEELTEAAREARGSYDDNDR